MGEKDKKSIAVEMSKLLVISNDVEAHKIDVSTCQEAFRNTPQPTAELENRMTDVNNGWEEIQELLKQREEELNGAAGYAIQELLIWIDQTRGSLQSIDIGVEKDKKSIRVEISKLRAISNDIDAHRITMSMCQDAFRNNPQPTAELENQMTDLNNGWEEIQELLKEAVVALQEVKGAQEDQEETYEVYEYNEEHGDEYEEIYEVVEYGSEDDGEGEYDEEYGDEGRGRGRGRTSTDEDDAENEKQAERDLLTLLMISWEYRDIPDAVKFQWKRDRTILTDIDREFITRGRTFHARKARRHRLRRWQDEMANSALLTILQAMENSHEEINHRTRRFM